jgi:hypothetical protein
MTVAVRESWALPRRTLGVSVVLTVALMLPLGLGYGFAGLPAALGIGMGYVAALQPALSLPSKYAAALTVPAAMAGAVAVGLRGSPVAAACFVALSCLLAAPAAMVADGLLARIPTVAAVLVAVPGQFDPAATAGWMLLGGLWCVLLATKMSPRHELKPLPARIAWVHASVMALTAAVFVLSTMELQVPHGYWAAMTLTLVLRANPGETWLVAVQRIVGTVGGALVALSAAWLLPLWAIGVALMISLVLSIGYSVVGDNVRQVMFMTPTVILLGSAGSSSVLALERTLMTLGGALVAIGLAFVLYRMDAASVAATQGQAGQDVGTEDE